MAFTQTITLYDIGGVFRENPSWFWQHLPLELDVIQLVGTISFALFLGVILSFYFNWYSKCGWVIGTSKKIGIIVPTLGTRPDYLQQCLKSIRSSGDCYISVVSADKVASLSRIDQALFDHWIQDPMQGLATAISLGVKSLPKSVEYFSWLGDDDILAPNSLTHSFLIMAHDSDIVCVFGKCQYMNAAGDPIWMNRSGRFATSLMRFGPQLIPQPGSLFSRAAFNAVGGLNPRYKQAFDLDLFIKLSKIGKLKYTPVQLSSFRWHENSLSVCNRKLSTSEAKAIRQLYLHKFVRPISPLWEYPLSRLIYHGGKAITALNRIKK